MGIDCLRELIGGCKIVVGVEARGTEITADGVSLLTPSGTRMIPAGSVVIAVRCEPGTPLRLLRRAEGEIGTGAGFSSLS